MSLPPDNPPLLASGTILKRAEAAALLETVWRRLFYERIRMIKIFFIPFQIQYTSQMEGLIQASLLNIPSGRPVELFRPGEEKGGGREGG